MRTVIEIYKEYRLMSGLQMHQLRVAAVGALLARVTLGIHERDVILTCLFHDMGNIIKSQLDVFPEFLEPEGLAYWQKVKEEYVQKFGDDEHDASVAIARELALPAKVVEMIDTIGFSSISVVAATGSGEMQICEYADMRVGPHGIISLSDRAHDLKKRYSPGWSRDTYVERERSFEEKTTELAAMEKQLFADLKIKPEDINDKLALPIIEELRKFTVS